MFDRTYVVSLARRPDRLQAFFAGLPAAWATLAPEPKPFAAVDGQLVPAPEWWKQGAGAWGCYRSHLAILERCLNENVDSVLVLEDDATFPADFVDRARTYLEHVPDDWEMLYLGGQCIKQAKPTVVNEHVLAPKNVNRTHAFALRGRAFLGRLYQHLHAWQTWKTGHHVDHHFGRLHESGTVRVYCPAEWLVGQAAGKSDIKADRRAFPERFWPAPARLAGVPLPEREPAGAAAGGPRTWLVVLGLHSSGSSALAGVCYHLGCHMGSRLGGYYGSDPERGACGFEAGKLARLCEQAIPFPSIERVQPGRVIAGNLRTWLVKLASEARRMGTVAALKYPMLCRMGDELVASTSAGRLLVLDCDRPFEQSVRSLVRRCPHRPAGQLEAHQRWLLEGKQEFLSQLAPDQVLRVTYDELLEHPTVVALHVAEFAGLDVNEERINRAAASVDAGKRHVA